MTWVTVRSSVPHVTTYASPTLCDSKHMFVDRSVLNVHDPDEEGGPED